MDKLKIGVIDLVCKGPSNALWSRIMYPNLASIMPQCVASWCEDEGHEVSFICYTGKEDIPSSLPKDLDVLFITSFTQAALFAYAISNYYRQQKVVTVLGGPHARCYPDDALNYFDYVLGFTNKEIIDDVLRDRVSGTPGKHLTASKQPLQLPGVVKRWKYIEMTLQKAPLIKMVPMLASLGCPYTCAFCIDSVVPYQPFDFQVLKQDLQFVTTKFKNPYVAWHDPNFGIRFEENMEAIADASPKKNIRFIAESSLSVLTEKHLKVLHENGFRGILPGIETWFELGNKSRTSHIKGIQKVNQVSEHVNTIIRHIPYVQTNFVLGLDSDIGEEPFELTKRFIDLTPAAFPGYSLLTAFGEAAPLNLAYQEKNRVLPFPFHFLNNHLAMNVKPLNYEWIDFYDKVIDLTEYTFSVKAVYRRFTHTPDFTGKWMNVMRAVSSEGNGRIRFYRKVRKLLSTDRTFRDFFEGDSTVLPEFYSNIIRKDLGSWWQWLPQQAIMHDQNAYLHKSHRPVAEPVHS